MSQPDPTPAAGAQTSPSSAAPQAPSPPARRLDSILNELSRLQSEIHKHGTSTDSQSHQLNAAKGEIAALKAAVTALLDFAKALERDLDDEYMARGEWYGRKFR